MQRKNRGTDADAPLYSILVIGHWWCCAKSRSSCAGVSLVSLVVVDGTKNTITRHILKIVYNYLICSNQMSNSTFFIFMLICFYSEIQQISILVNRCVIVVIFLVFS